VVDSCQAFPFQTPNSLRMSCIFLPVDTTSLPSERLVFFPLIVGCGFFIFVPGPPPPFLYQPKQRPARPFRQALFLTGPFLEAYLQCRLARCGWLSVFPPVLTGKYLRELLEFNVQQVLPVRVWCARSPLASPLSSARCFSQTLVCGPAVPIFALSPSWILVPITPSFVAAERISCTLT